EYIGAWSFAEHLCIGVNDLIRFVECNSAIGCSVNPEALARRDLSTVAGRNSDTTCVGHEGCATTVDVCIVRNIDRVVHASGPGDVVPKNGRRIRVTDQVPSIITSTRLSCYAHGNRSLTECSPGIDGCCCGGIRVNCVASSLHQRIAQCRS